LRSRHPPTALVEAMNVRRTRRDENRVARRDPARRMVNGPTASDSACRKVSEPRCSATLTVACHSPPVVEMSACSGRIPIVVAPRLAAASPRIRFIFGEPMNPATNNPFGRL
jgi:hypothetical protein